MSMRFWIEMAPSSTVTLREPDQAAKSTFGTGRIPGPTTMFTFGRWEAPQAPSTIIPVRPRLITAIKSRGGVLSPTKEPRMAVAATLTRAGAMRPVAVARPHTGSGALTLLATVATAMTIGCTGIVEDGIQCSTDADCTGRGEDDSGGSHSTGGLGGPTGPGGSDGASNVAPETIYRLRTT